MSYQNVGDLLTDSEKAVIDNAPIGSTGRFPTWHPIFSPKQTKTDHLSNHAVSLVSTKGDQTWLASLNTRLTNIANAEDAAAALAELRVYGAFLEAAFKVKPIQVTAKPTPDFEVDVGDGPVAVEVFAKHQHAQGPSISTPSNQANSNKNIQITITTHFPAGSPDPKKKDDCTQANVISRVCGAKGSEKQFPTDKPCLLWIDFRTFGAWPGIISLDQCQPLISGHNGLCSGALWYAFFGWEKAPIFEEYFDFNERTYRMGHAGRFRLDGKSKSKLSGVILALTDGCVMFENPWANNPLQDRTRRHIERLPWFNLGHSIIEYSKGDAANCVAMGRNQINYMHAWHKRLNA
jgi:hypothetical protein